MQQPTFDEIFERFSGLRVLVVGDIMLDVYMWGKVERISPEAPVPIVSVNKREARLGGAGNVGLNLVALGAVPIICTVVGKDQNGIDISALCDDACIDKSGVLAVDDRPTTCKTRILGSHQQILRVDEESTKSLTVKQQAQLLAIIEKQLDTSKIDVIVFQDYDKGALSSGMIEAIVKKANEMDIPTAVDPKYKNFFSYTDTTLFKPNLKELAESVKMDLSKDNIDGVKHALAVMQERLHNKISLVTLSEKGVLLNGGGETHLLPAHVRSISDVSGAGDTVISIASLCLALGVSPRTLAELANLGGGQVCEKVGVVPVDKAQLLAEAKKLLPSQ